jgi:hypothetical protein
LLHEHDPSHPNIVVLAREIEHYLGLPLSYRALAAECCHRT